MRFTPIQPPRRFQCGRDNHVTLSDCGRVQLEPGEVIAFPAVGGFTYRIRREAWGYFVSDALNDQARNSDWCAVIAGENFAKAHLMYVEIAAMQDYREYCGIDGIEVFVEFLEPAEAQHFLICDHDPDEVHSLALRPDEQVTLTTPTGSELDVTRKSWGFYGTSSFEWRLGRYNLTPHLLSGDAGDRYLAIAESGHENQFERSISQIGLTEVQWRP